MKKKFKKYILNTIITISLIYLSVLVLLFLFQRNLLYHPNENNYSGDKLRVDIERSSN